MRRFLVDKEGILRVGGFLQLIGQVSLFLFIGGLTSVFARAEGEPAVLSRSFFATGIAAGAVSLAALVPMTALVYVNGNAARTSDDVIALTWNSTWLCGAITLCAIALFLGIAGTLILRTGVFAKWLGWAGVAAAVVALVSSLGFMTVDLGFLTFVGFPVALLWVVLTSIVSLTRKETAEVRVAAAA